MAKKTQSEEVKEPTISDKKYENSQNFERLTQKNKDYMVKLNRRLDEMGVSEERKVEAFYQMYPVIIDQQEKHVPARKVYGTIAERANYIVENPNGGKEQAYERSEWWKLYLDGALLLGGMFALISGISFLFGNDASGLGLVTLLLNYIVGGAAMLVITHFAPVPGQKGGFIKYLLATTLTMAAWILLMSFGTVLVPPELNPFVPGSVTLIIGVLSLVLKWYLKRELNIRGTLV